MILKISSQFSIQFSVRYGKLNYKMIELQKHVLNQVCFDQDLFLKELRKCKKLLKSKEIVELKNWLLEKNQFKNYTQWIKTILF